MKSFEPPAFAAASVAVQLLQVALQRLGVGQARVLDLAPHRRVAADQDDDLLPGRGLVRRLVRTGRRRLCIGIGCRSGLHGEAELVAVRGLPWRRCFYVQPSLAADVQRRRDLELGCRTSIFGVFRGMPTANAEG